MLISIKKGYCFLSVSPNHQIFVQGITSFSAEERKNYARKNITPPHWQQGVFAHNNTATPYFLSRAPVERAIVIGSAGLNSLHLLSVDEVEKLNNAGISVVWMALPLPKRHDNIDLKATNLMRAFLTSPHSPAHMLFPSDVPRYLATHSTSGRIALQLLHEDETRKKLSSIFSGAVYVTPYLDTANSAISFNPYKNRIFSNFAKSYADYTPHETFVGRAYMALMGRHENYSKNGNDKSAPLTYQQILELQESSRSLLKNFNPKAANAFPSIFLVGDKDPFACHKTTMEVARRMGAEIIIAHGAGHYPMKHTPKLMDAFIEKVDECATRHAKQKSETCFISPDEFFLRHTRPAQSEMPDIVRLPKRLRDSAGRALERTASALNPLASILQ